MRTKLAAVLTIPLLGFIVVTGVQVTSSVRTSTELANFSRQIGLGRQVSALVHELERERDRSVGLLAALGFGPDAPARTVADLAPDRTAVDRAADALRSAARPLLGDPELAQAYRAAEAGLAELPRIREGVQSGWLRRQAAFDAYSRAIADLQVLLPLPATVGEDASLGQAVRAFANLARAKELTAQIRGLLFAVCSAGGFATGEFEAIADARAERQAALARFREDASAAQVTRFDDSVAGQAVRNASRLEQTIIDNASAPSLGVDAQQWWQASTTELELMRGAEIALLDAAIAGASAASSARWRATWVSSLASVLLLLVAVLASLVIGRSMARALRSLRQHALQIAQRALPTVIHELRAAPKRLPTINVERIPIRTADEVGEVAEAFTAVHRSAVRLAAEQAAMRHNVNAIFVNLARRSQALVERQLQLLDTLESAEQDPEQLGNLFRLDHLATRMRRNDENLLVLAGAEATRRWTQPVALTAIVLAAAAEIEHYPRVRHDIHDDLYVAGHVVADLVHLIAELLENATVFSPPDTTVNVLGWRDSDGGATLVIQDLGIGMSAEAVAQANRQLAGPVSIDVAAAERMGLVVVGHLAVRHGVRVEARSPTHGVSMLVRLPVGLLASAPPDALPWAGTEVRRIEARGAPVVDAAQTRELEAAAPRRGVPTRAEDVLGAGRSDGASMWWSRRGAALTGGQPIPVVTAPAPVDGGTSEAGLPVRVPMAQLPREQVAAPAVPRPREPDPAEVSSLLTRFYGGVHRAAMEEDDEGSDLVAARGGVTGSGDAAEPGDSTDAMGPRDATEPREATRSTEWHSVR